MEKAAISASEAPHLLLPSNERKPFVSPRAIRAFSVSTFVGVGCVGAVYYLLCQSMGESAIEEHQRVARLVNRPKVEQQAVKKTSLPTFTSPSSYEALVAKTKAPAIDAPISASITHQSPLLHEQISIRARAFWNSVITNVELALDQSVVQYYRRREDTARQVIERELLLDYGAQLIDLKAKEY